MNTHQKSSSTERAEAPSPATSATPGISGPLHFTATAVEGQRPSPSMPRQWAAASTALGYAGSINMRCETSNAASGALMTGKRRDLSHRTFAIRPFRQGHLCRRQSNRSSLICASLASRLHSSSSRTKPLGAFCSRSLCQRRSLLLAVSLQTTRRLLKHAL